MKIAVATEDDKNISQHFGRAPFYVVVTIEDGQITNTETRAKARYHTFAGRHRTDLTPGEKHGYNTGSEVRHAGIIENIIDCQVLIAGGMGQGAYDSLQNSNIKPIITDAETIDEALKLYLEDKLPNLMERLH
ncbi:NifB/NifX family molybdenum-iron cluster-binding protein [Chloroflexota bacterium]